MLYLIKSSNYLKIGYAQDVDKRMKDYRTHNPDFQLLSTRRGNKNNEAELHKLFKDKRHYGEWFEYSQEIIDTFDSYKFKEEDNNYEFTYISFNNEITNVITIQSCDKESAIKLAIDQLKEIKKPIKTIILFYKGKQEVVYDKSNNSDNTQFITRKEYKEDIEKIGQVINGLLDSNKHMISLVEKVINL